MEHGSETRATRSARVPPSRSDGAHLRSPVNTEGSARAAKDWDRAITATGDGRIAGLLPESGLHRDTLATLGAPAREHCLSALGFHPGTKSVRLRAVTPVGLERALRHERSATPQSG